MMKLLFENWRKYLTEAARNVEDLVAYTEDGPVYITIKPDVEDILIVYTDAEGEERPFDPKGGILITPITEDWGYPCDGAYSVMGSGVSNKWGPLLYDVAMEYATIHGNGLVADREIVSPQARAVWDYYLDNRGDVDHHQLDDLKNTLTPEIEVDNCDQYVASVGGKYDWVENSLSKRYTKAPTTITELEKLGRLIDET